MIASTSRVAQTAITAGKRQSFSRNFQLEPFASEAEEKSLFAISLYLPNRIRLAFTLSNSKLSEKKVGAGAAKMFTSRFLVEHNSQTLSLCDFVTLSPLILSDLAVVVTNFLVEEKKKN
jgi:hypothetical protein